MARRRRTVIGVMGGAQVSPEVERMAEELGRQIALAGYCLLSGGRPKGVMLACSRGASNASGLVIGVLPDADPDCANEFVDISIATHLADGRNLINILSSDVVIACPGGGGTLSEVGYAIRNRRPLVLLGMDAGPIGEEAIREGLAARAHDPTEAMEHVRRFLERLADLSWKRVSVQEGSLAD